MFKQISLYFLFFIVHATAYTNPLPNRELIILLETIKYETLDKTLNAPNVYEYKDILHPVGIGATTMSLLIALYQETAPIVVNKSLLKNVIDHQNLFSDFITLDRQTLHKKYMKYNRLRGRSTLDTFRQNCQRASSLTSSVNSMLKKLIKNDKNDFDKILNHILNHPEFQGNSFPEIKNAMSNTSYLKSLNLEMRMFILCSSIDLDKDWDIKQVNDDIFLLVPKNYISSLHPNFSVRSPVTDKKSLLTLTNLELELGLKIDHMKSVTRSFFEQTQSQPMKTLPFTKSLEQIFVMNDDLKMGDSSKKINHVWSFYFSGHGLPKHPQLEILPQLYDLKKFYTTKLSSADSVKKIHIAGPTTKVHHKKEYEAKIRKLDHEIKKAEKLKNTPNKINQGMINSLSIHEFKDVLTFLNDNINTAFMYYYSCYSGGPHLIEPYVENKKSKLLKYTIMIGTPAENVSLQEFPFINIPPYFTDKQELLFEPLDITQIDQKNKKLALTTPLRFDNFFKLLRKGIHTKEKNLILLPYSLHPHVDQFGKIIPRRIANTPLVRFAYSDHFEVIPHDTSSVLLHSNSSLYTSLNKNSNLIFSDHITSKLTIDKLDMTNEIPKIVSMVPGFALHTFEEISSSTLSLEETINSFLTFPELGSSKIFWIKKLTCKNDAFISSEKATFKDVIIMRNVFNSAILSACSTQDPMRLKPCVYFSTNTHKQAKLTWDGPFIETNNYKISPCYESEYKEECLHFFPEAAHFINPTLKTI